MLAGHDYSLLARWLNSESFTRYLRNTETPGVEFRPWRDGGAEGSSLTIAPDSRTNLTGLGVYMLSGMHREARTDLFRRSSASKLDIFYKVCGGTFIRTPGERRRIAATHHRRLAA